MISFNLSQKLDLKPIEPLDLTLNEGLDFSLPTFDLEPAIELALVSEGALTHGGLYGA